MTGVSSSVTASTISWGALANAAALADDLPGFDDLLCALLGVRHHRLRQAMGLELVGVMAL